MENKNEVSIVPEYGKDGTCYLVQLEGRTLREFSSTDFPSTRAARDQSKRFARELRERLKPAAVIKPDAVPEFADWLHQSKRPRF